MCNEGISDAEGKLQVYVIDEEKTTLIYEIDLELFSGETFIHTESAENIPHSGSSITVYAVITPASTDRYSINNSDTLIVFYDDKHYVSYDNILILPTSVCSIEAEAFANGGFEAVETSSKLERIGSLAFANCDALKQVRLGDKVCYIADDAFIGSGEVILWCPYGSYAAEYA